MELNKFISHLATSYFRIKGIYRYRVPGNSRGKEKAAPYPGFIFPISGCAEYHFNDTPYLISSGTVIHGCGGGIIQKRVVGDQEWEFIVILYDPLQEPNDFKLVNTHFSFKVNMTPLLIDKLRQIHEISNLPSGFAAFQVETLARYIIEETFLSARNQIQKGAKELFDSATDFIHNHYMEPISVSILAEQSNVNENRLFYVFQKYVGIGPGEYLLNYRLNRAKDLIVTSTISIKDIAIQVGYVDSLYFSRIFKKHFGLPPSEFRH